MKYLKAFVSGTLRGFLILGFAGLVGMGLVGLSLHQDNLPRAGELALAGFLGLGIFGLMVGGTSACLHLSRQKAPTDDNRL